MKSKNKNKQPLISPLIRMLKYRKVNVIWYFVLVSITAISSVAYIISPILLKDFIANIVRGGTEHNWDQIEDKIILLGLLILSCQVLVLILDSFVTIKTYHISNKIANDFRKLLNAKLNKLPLEHFDATISGDTLNTITTDCNVIAEDYFYPIYSVVSVIAFTIGLLIAMFLTSWQLSLACLAVLIVSGIILSILIPNSNKSSIKQAKLSGKMSGMVEEIYSGILIVKAFNKETSVEQQFEKQNNQLYHVSRVARTWASMFHVVINFGKFTGQMAICITAAIVATTLPQDEAILLIAMIPTFIIFVYALNYPITQIADNLYRIFCASASCHRIFDVLDKKEIVYTKDTIPIPPDIKGRIIFKNVKFGYNNSKPIIKNLNFKAEPGQKIAIVGSTGAGKTTIVNLIMRFYEINSGKITIDDIDISKMNVLELRNMFGMVLQDTWTFKGTIRDNILYTSSGVSKQQLDKICEDANILHYIKTLPQGYDTVIDEFNNMSNGEKQLLTIARVIAKRPRLIIFDEATSNVDTITEMKIQKAMDKLMQNKTSFVIAHRISTIKDADLILVIKNGDISEQGTHEQLLAKKGTYYELFHTQFSGS